MKAAVCCVKQKGDAVNCLRAFSDGIIYRGDEAIWMAPS